MVSALDFRSEDQWLEDWSLPSMLEEKQYSQLLCATQTVRVGTLWLIKSLFNRHTDLVSKVGGDGVYSLHSAK